MTKFLNNADIKGYIAQTAVTSYLLKADSTGRLVAAIAGTDYQAPTTALLPSGGTAGQILAKIDGTNYNAQWIDNFAQQIKYDVKLGAALSKGTPVYVSSANGTNIIVSASSNSTEATSSKTLGLLETGGALNDIVKVVSDGLLSGLNTSAATIGDPVWLGVNGALIFGLANKPSAPAHLVYIGAVTRVHATNGEIFIKVQNGFELDELHNVALSSVADGQGLFYESATSLWKNKTIASVLGYTPANGANYLPLSGGTISGDLTISSTNPRIYFTDTDNNPDYFISNTDGTFTVYDVTNSVGRFKIYSGGNAEFNNNLTAASFIKSGGTSAQFLKADGSVDSSTYLTSITSSQVTTALGYTPYNATNPSGYITSSALASYLPLSGGTLSGALTINGGSTSSFATVIQSTSTFAFGTTNGRRIAVMNVPVGDQPGLQFGYDATDNTGILAGSTQANGAGIDFYTYDGSSWANRLRIAKSGAATFSSSIAAGGIVTAPSQFQLSGSSLPTGLNLGVGGNTPLLEFHANFRNSQNTTYRGGELRIDTRDGQSLFSFLSRAAGSTVDNFLLSLSEAGQLKLTTYTSATSYTGTAAGYLAFDSSGNIITVAGVSSTVTAGFSLTTAGAANNTPSTPSVNAGVYAGTYAFIDLATQDVNGSWIDFSKGNGTDFAGRIRYYANPDRFGFHTNGGSEVITFDAGGNIVLSGGSSSAQSTLASGLTAIRFPNQYSSGYTDAGVKLYIFNSGTTIQGFTAGPAYDLQYHSSGSDSGRHAFYVANSEIIRFNKTNVAIYGALQMATSGTSYIRMGQFPQSTSNSGETWIGRAADRSAGSMTVQLGGSSNASFFEIVDYAWTTVTFKAGMNDFSYKGNAILHAGNYNSYSPTLTGGGASGTWNISVSGSSFSINGNITSDGWLRTVGDSTQLKFYGNSRTMVYRTDGNTNPHGGGGYAHIFYYGGSADGNRVFIVNTDGRLYSPYHGWLDTMNISGSSGGAPWSGISSKPSLLMYYQGFTLDANTMDGNSTGFTYSVNAPYTGPIARFSETGYSLQLNAAYAGSGTQIAFRTRNGDAGTFNPWRAILNDANYTSYTIPIGGSWGADLTSNGFTRKVGVSYDGGEWVILTANAQISTLIDGTYFAGESGGFYSLNGSNQYSSRVGFNRDGNGYAGFNAIVNAPSGFVSMSNPWGTANSAYFPNGITTAGGQNWIYGATFIGNAPSNGSGVLINSNGSSYFRSNVGTNSHGSSARFHEIQSAAGNFIPYSFESEYGNHSWGTVLRIRINQVGADRPSMQFSYAGTDNRWNVGYCYPDDQFRVTQNMAYRNDNSTSDGWGTERFRINTNGDTYAAIGGTLYANGNQVLTYAGGTLSNNYTFRSNLGGYLGSIESPPLQVYSESNNSAFMSFHKRGYYAVNFGLDADNVMRIGGWSASANRWQLDMSGNQTIAGDYYGNNHYANGHFRPYGDYGLYSQDYGGVFRRNTNSYGTWESVGYAKNGWGGYVNNNNYIVSWMLNTSGDFGFLTQNGNWWNLFYNNGNNCWGIGTDNTYSGDGFRCIKYGSAQYGWTTWSDRRAKENISTITGALDKVLNMRGVYFNYIIDEAKNKRVGFIAQELQQALPEAVRYAEEIDEYNVEYGQIVSVLAEAVKEHYAKTVAQQIEIDALKTQLQTLLN